MAASRSVSLRRGLLLIGLFLRACAEARSPTLVSTSNLPWDATLPFVKRSVDGEMVFVSGVNGTIDSQYVKSQCSAAIATNASDSDESVEWERCSKDRLEHVLKIEGDIVTSCGGDPHRFEYKPPGPSTSPGVDYLSKWKGTPDLSDNCDANEDIVVYNWRTDKELMRFRVNSSFTVPGTADKKWVFGLMNLVASTALGALSLLAKT